MDSREFSFAVYDNNELNLVSLDAADALEAYLMAVCKQSHQNYMSLYDVMHYWTNKKLSGT